MSALAPRLPVFGRRPPRAPVPPPPLTPERESAECAVLAFARQHGRIYSGDTLRHLLASGFGVSFSAVKSLLLRMQERGLFTSVWEPPQAGRSGPGRRMFALTEKGGAT